MRKSVYAPGASSDAGAAGGGACPGARKCFARTVTRYCVLGDSPVENISLKKIDQLHSSCGLWRNTHQ